MSDQQRKDKPRDQHKDTVTVVVGGVPTEVEMNERNPLRTLVPKALAQTGNTGRPPHDWVLTDGSGRILDLDRAFGEFEFPADAKLFLDLQAGVAGDGGRP